MKMEERRKEKREALLINVAVDISGDQKWYELRSRDISTGGMCLITDISIPIETPLEIEFCLPNINIPIEVFGEVVCRKYSIKEDYFYYGIMFINLSTKYKELIKKYMKNASLDL